jgi:hypothetical protein
MSRAVHQEMLMTRKSSPNTAKSAKAPRTDPKAPRAKAKAPNKSAGETTAKAAAKPTRKPAARALPAPAGPVATSVSLPSAESKQGQLIASLRSASGVPLAQIMALTGWQAHTVRAVISAVLRKKLGLTVACDAAPKGGERLYRIVRNQAA